MSKEEQFLIDFQQQAVANDTEPNSKAATVSYDDSGGSSTLQQSLRWQEGRETLNPIPGVLAWGLRALVGGVDEVLVEE